jgi:hypothetical protein
MPGPNVVSTSAITIHYNKPNRTVFFNTTINTWNYPDTFLLLNVLE